MENRVSERTELTTKPLVEVRARITADDTEAEWGIRSRVVRLTEGVRSDSAPLHISPVALVAVAWLADMIIPRPFAFKTWVGRRYDHHAVPDDQVALATDIAGRARSP